MKPATVLDRTATVANAAEPAPAVSIVVPFVDEVANLPVLVARLKPVLDGLDRRAEVVLVDDGSTDGSPDAAIAAIDRDGRFRLVRLRTNYGKSAALAAGRDHSVGDVVVTMDADMQDPPEAIPRFLALIDDGYDVVAGWRHGRRAPWQRRLGTAMFNRCVRTFGRVAIHDMNCGMKAYRRHALETIHLSPGMHRFTVMLAHGNGFRVGELQVPNDERLSGKTKYGAGRYFEAALGFVAALYVRRPSRSPLMSLGSAGVGAILVSLLAGVAHALWGPTATTARVVVLVTVVALSLLGALLLVSGLVGELILQRLAGSARPAPLYLLHDARDGQPRPQ